LGLHGFVARDQFESIYQFAGRARITGFHIKTVRGFLDHKIMAAVRCFCVAGQRRGFAQIERFAAGGPDKGCAYIFHAVKVARLYYQTVNAILSFRKTLCFLA